jgi:2-keto-4-pentenoate hydratase/2-oxohepta-3-ene-1,7-dioic acid hydratase in catechol pathway
MVAKTVKPTCVEWHARRFLLPWAVVLLLGACSPGWEPAFDSMLDPGALESVAIADVEKALTFARTRSDGPRRLIAVTRYEAGKVEGVDLSVSLGRHVDDPIRVFLEEGYDGLRDIVLRKTPGATLAVAAEELELPVDLRDHHVAAGTNFPEHAGETSVEHGPFLFPKLVRPTGPYSSVSVGTALLDYEVELAWVPLEPLADSATLPEYLGLILCNDYTDRAMLLRGLAIGNVESGEGFATGKSFPGYLPVGNLFVVPRDFRAFVEGIELRLYVNERLRQRSAAREMIWDIDEILAQTWARRDLSWEHRGKRVSLLGESGLVSDRILVLSGTPHGTVFRGIPTGQKLLGFLTWLLGGWEDSIPNHAISIYIDDARSAGVYLQPGDRVAIHVDNLGVIRNEVMR